MRICVDFGHGTGEDRGASGYFNEEKVIREYGPLVIDGLRKLGHTVIDVTPTQSGLTLAQSLSARVNGANAKNVDLFVSLHVNAWDENNKAFGCEVEYASDSGKAYADKIRPLIATALGVKDRGGNFNASLYVLKYTQAPAILVEPFFCTSIEDCNKYNAKKLANAIIKGITGQDVYVDTPAPAPAPAPTVKTFDTSIPTGDNITPLAGGIGYIETIKDGDGRVVIHLDKYTYISMQNAGQESHIDVFTRQGKSLRLI